MKNLFITKEDHLILTIILQPVPYEVLVFGSRIKGTHQKFSDLDLCLKSNKSVSLEDIAELKERLRDSDLPFIVDIINYHDVSDGFKKIIDRDGILFSDTKPAL